MKKNLTKIFFIALVAAFSLTACKKSSNNNPTSSGNFSLKATINDTTVTFTSCLAADITANGIAQVNILGSNKNSDQAVTIDLIAALSSLKAGETFQAATDFNQPNTAIIFYTDKNDNDFLTSNSNPTCSVTITSVTSTAVSGMFTTAKLYAFSDLSATTVKNTIASGTFTAELPGK